MTWIDSCTVLAVSFGNIHVADHWIGILIGGNLFWAIIGYFIAASKGNECWGCGMGCLLGPLGILIAMLMPRSK